jgi:hypothetical protein
MSTLLHLCCGRGRPPESASGGRPL